MRAFEDVRQDAHRLCSDFTAGRASRCHFELGTAEFLRQRAGCHAVAFWKRMGTGTEAELRCMGRLHQGRVDAANQPAPVPADRMQDYLKWMSSSGYLTHDATSPDALVVQQAWRLHCAAAVAFLHVPTYYNGSLCGVVSFSDHSNRIAWNGAKQREIQQLIALVMVYFSPQQMSEISAGNSE